MKWLMFGYAEVKTKPLLAQIKQDNVALIDIRFFPSSISPYRRKDYFEQQLPDHYLSLPQWGNVNFKEAKDIQISDFDGGWITLTKWLEGKSFEGLLLMCGCWDEDTCHRSVVAQWLKEQHGIEVCEISTFLRSLK